MVSLLSNDFWQHGISSNRAVICLFVGSKNSPKYYKEREGATRL